MYISSQNNSLNHFYKELNQISQNLLDNKSINIRINSGIFNISSLIKSFATDFYLRKNLLGKFNDDFIFLEISRENIDFSNFVTNISEYISKTLDSNEIEIQNLKNICSFLYSKRKQLVIFSKENDIELLRNLFSLKLFLGNNLLFIFNSKDLEFEDFNKVEISDLKIKNIIDERIKKLELNLSTNEIFSEINGDIEKIDFAIIKNLSNNKIIEPIVIPIKEEIQKFEIKQENKDISKIKSEKNLKIVFPSKKTKSQSKLPEDLTDREKEIFEELKSKKFISRDNLAKFIWKEKAEEKANDNAIDKIISRLRSKFVKSGFDKSYITSKKGVGIELKD